MARDECRMPGCHDSPETGRFCSEFHELKYDDLLDDARQVERDMQEREGRIDRSDLPEYDGPPY